MFALPTRKATVSKADAEKADYIMLEAMKHKALDSIDACIALVERAYELNPNDLYIGKEYGMYEALLGAGKSQWSVDHGFDLMMRYIRENPSDIVTGTDYVRMASRLGRTDYLKVLRLLYENISDPTEIGSVYASGLAMTGNADSIRKAISVLDRMESFDGRSTQSTVEKIKYMLALGDTAAVFDEAHRLLATSPQSVEFNSFMGQVCMEFGRQDSAIYYFDKAVELDPGSGMAYYARAQYYNTIGDSAAYDREVFQALRHPDLDLEPKTEILRSYVSQLYTDSTQRGRITGMFQSLVDQYPHEEQVRNLYGSYLWLVNDYPGAAEQYNYMLSLNPDNQDSWGALAQIYYTMEEYGQAEKTVDDAIKYFPSETQFYLLGSSVALAGDNPVRANDYLTRALAIADTTDAKTLSSIYGALGDVAYKMDDTASTWQYYQKAFEYDHDNSILLNNMAYYMACTDTDLDRALEYIKKALDIEMATNEENSATTLDTYAWVLFKRRDYAQAKETIDSVLELGEEDSSADVLEHAGDIYFMNGNPAEALEFWEQALKLNPDNELLQRKVKNKTFFFK